ncbi:MAG: bacteriohemerythrin [Ignavibacteriales bacterium]|nr:bacteriohemerythrin [Ignavibacteriales bacterium]
MSFIDFRAEYKVYIRSIDCEHEIIAGIVNSIHESILKTDKKITLAELNRLLEVLESHFENEERLMKENQFPGYFSHKLEHDRFYNQMLETIEKFGKEQTALDSNSLLGIRRWFFNHIDINDRKCGQFLSDKGIS